MTTNKALLGRWRCNLRRWTAPAGAIVLDLCAVGLDLLDHIDLARVARIGAISLRAVAAVDRYAARSGGESDEALALICRNRRISVRRRVSRRPARCRNH